MRKIFLFLASSVSVAGVFISCKKEYSCENCLPTSNNPVSANKPPIAKAAPDTVLTLSDDSVLLDGSASMDPDGKITASLWTKISGPSSSLIVNSTQIKTIVRNLVVGTYAFELKVTDNNGISGRDTARVVVNHAAVGNKPPIAKAGADQTITLPVNAVNLDGSASTDPDNNIASYQWTKISGPPSFSITNPNATQTQVTNLIEGTYYFELKVTDAGGLFDRDTMQVTVNPELSPPSSPSCPQPRPRSPCSTNCGKIVFVSDRDGNSEIYTCSDDGSNVMRLTNDAVADGDPAWSPDGTRVAFIKNMDSNGMGNLCIMNADGSNLVQKTFTNDIKNPTWSPDGTRIAFTDMIDQARNSWFTTILVLDLTNGTVSQIPQQQYGNNTLYGSSVIPKAAWSPDGTKIAFDSDWNAWDFISDIFTICPQGSELTTVTSKFFNDYDYWKPSWSPDGMKLSVTIHPLNNPSVESSIAVINLNGTGLTIIKTAIGMSGDSGITRTSWSPDGMRIAYTDSKTIKWVAANGSTSGIIVANGWDADWHH